MNRRDFESLNVFDGDKFLVWKYHMEICLEEKDIMLIVSGTIPKPPDGALEAEKIALAEGKHSGTMHDKFICHTTCS